MKKLQTWMNRNGWRDHHVAEKVNVTRTQVSRIRRKKSGCSVETAKALAKLTGIRWTYFIDKKASAA